MVVLANIIFLVFVFFRGRFGSRGCWSTATLPAVREVASQTDATRFERSGALTNKSESFSDLLAVCGYYTTRETTATLRSKSLGAGPEVEDDSDAWNRRLKALVAASKSRFASQEDVRDLADEESDAGAAEHGLSRIACIRTLPPEDIEVKTQWLTYL